MRTAFLQGADVSQQISERRYSLLPLGISVALLTALCAVDLLFTIKLCDGHFVYPLDDTYIGAAMAKNFALYGVWGVTRHAFNSATSAPFWILLLSAAYRVFGVSQWTALVLSFIFALLTLFVADRLLLRPLPARTRTLGLVALVLFTPLHVVGLIGMEHALHILLTLIFLRLSADLLVEHRWSLWLWPLVPIMTMVRYESLFLVASIVLFLALQRRWKWAAGLAALAWLPVIGYGALSVSKGWYWLPNSISIKGASEHDFFHHLLGVSFNGPHLVAVLVVLPILARIARADRRAAYMLWTVFLTGCLHLSMADVGWTYRYEDYLLAAAVVASTVAFSSIQKALRAEPALALVLFVPIALLAGRCAMATVRLPKFSHAIYSQQYQMSRFVRRYYNGQAIAANDVGAINFYSDITCVDLAGLSNRDIFFAKRSHSYTTSVINEETEEAHVSIAIVYDSWFSDKLSRVGPSRFGGPPLPSHWKRIARWKINDQEELGGNTVSFYAVRPGEAGRLRHALREFDPSLPRGVTVFQN